AGRLARNQKVKKPAYRWLRTVRPAADEPAGGYTRKQLPFESFIQFRRRRVVREFDMNLNNTAAVCHRHFELITIDLNGFTAGGKMAERLHDQATDGIHFFIAEAGAKGLVKIFDGRQRSHRPGMTAQLAEIVVLFLVVFVVNLADD